MHPGGVLDFLLRRGLEIDVAPERIELAPLSGVLNHPTRFSGGRSPFALNDHRLPSGNPPGWLRFEPGECSNSGEC